MWAKDGFIISTDASCLDVDTIYRSLHGNAYWSRGIPREIVVRALASSLNFHRPYQEPAG